MSPRPADSELCPKVVFDANVSVISLENDILDMYEIEIVRNESNGGYRFKREFEGIIDKKWCEFC